MFHQQLCLICGCKRDSSPPPPPLHNSGVSPRQIACQLPWKRGTVSRSVWRYKQSRFYLGHPRPGRHQAMTTRNDTNVRVKSAEMISSESQGSPNRMTTSHDSCGLRLQSSIEACWDVTHCTERSKLINFLLLTKLLVTVSLPVTWITTVLHCLRLHVGSLNSRITNQKLLTTKRIRAPYAGWAARV